MEEAVVELQVSPCSEGRQEQPQEEQPPARGRQDPAAAARGSDQAEEAAAGGPAGGAPACAAAADAAASGPQASPASLPSHMLVTVPPAAERAAEQPVTAEPPRKRVRFSSDALEEAVPPSGGLAPAGGKQGMPALPPLPPQLAAAAHGLAAAGALGFGQQMLQHEAGMPEQDELLQLHALMAQAQQQQQRRQQPQQQAASPSLSPWLPQQAQYGTVAGARHAIGQLHATPVLRLEDVSQLAVQAATGMASPYALVSVSLLQALHRAALFAVREAQANLESKLRQQAANADAVAAAWPPQPAAVAAAAAELQDLLRQVQQVARIAKAMEPREVPLLPIQRMLEQQAARLQLLLSESLRAAAAALQGNGGGAADAPTTAGLFGAPGVPPWQQPQAQLPPTPRPASPAPNLLSELLPMLLAGQQVAAGQHAIARLVVQHPQRGQGQQAQQQQQQQQQPANGAYTLPKEDQ